jgi:hypothetical protein
MEVRLRDAGCLANSTHLLSTIIINFRIPINVHGVTAVYSSAEIESLLRLSCGRRTVHRGSGGGDLAKHVWRRESGVTER